MNKRLGYTLGVGLLAGLTWWGSRLATENDVSRIVEGQLEPVKTEVGNLQEQVCQISDSLDVLSTSNYQFSLKWDDRFNSLLDTMRSTELRFGLELDSQGDRLSRLILGGFRQQTFLLDGLAQDHDTLLANQDTLKAHCSNTRGYSITGTDANQPSAGSTAKPSKTTGAKPLGQKQVEEPSSQKSLEETSLPTTPIQESKPKRKQVTDLEGVTGIQETYANRFNPWSSSVNQYWAMDDSLKYGLLDSLIREGERIVSYQNTEGFRLIPNSQKTSAERLLASLYGDRNQFSMTDSLAQSLADSSSVRRTRFTIANPDLVSLKENLAEHQLYLRVTNSDGELEYNAALDYVYDSDARGRIFLTEGHSALSDSSIAIDNRTLVTYLGNEQTAQRNLIDVLEGDRDTEADDVRRNLSRRALLGETLTSMIYTMPSFNEPTKTYNTTPNGCGGCPSNR